MYPWMCIVVEKKKTAAAEKDDCSITTEAEQT